VEPGEFRVRVGSSSEDMRLEGSFRISGAVRVVGDGERVLDTPADVARLRGGQTSSPSASVAAGAPAGTAGTPADTAGTPADTAGTHVGTAVGGAGTAAASVPEGL
ncbi:MAG: hypothetical protein ACTH8V_12450, partial [Brachybacterium tyrofermentans]